MTGVDKKLEMLADLVAAVVDSPHSSFYRDLYGVSKGSRPNLTTWDDWHLVPTFTKEAMLERPAREYTFVPHTEIDTLYYTSGTSGKPPAFCPRVAYDGGFMYRKSSYNFAGSFLYSIKAQHRADLFLTEMGSLPRSLYLDSKNLAACVRLAKAVGVDSMGVHTFTIQTIGEEMKRVGMNEQIRLIDFVGETCSLMLYSYIRSTFPNTKIVSYYGLSEAEGAVAMTCRPLSDNEPYPVFHAHPDFYLELINTEGEVLVPKIGVEGELLMTDLVSNRAFPLIRYRPGDTVRVVDERCKEHGTWTFTVLGKTASDFMLIPGGQLRADEIERVLRAMPGVTDHFEMHRYDAGTPQKPILKVELHVQPLDPIADINILAQVIATELRVSPTRTYAMGVADGLYEPLVLKRLPDGPASAKHKRMVRH